MECNKDEAIRAKEIAERKFMEKNYSAAKKFILKAQNLFPGLEGISQMITTLNVYISVENKINGEMDWYGIIGVDHLADEEIIRKQYRKLALLLHPDKNKSPGAEGAFKWVREAWSLLSDKAKRLAYNQKRNLKIYRQKVPTQTRVPSAPPSANVFQNFTKNVASNAKTTQNKTRAGPPRKSDTFWTLCSRCKTHYEYLRIYLNQMLLCPSCHEGFLASEKAPPPNLFKSSNWTAQKQHRNSIEKMRSAGHKSFEDSKFQNGPHFSRPTAFGSSSGSSTSNATSVPQTSERLKRERDTESAVEQERSNEPHLKKKVMVNDAVNNGNGAHMGIADGGSGFRSISESLKGNPEIQSIYGFYGISNTSNIKMELSLSESRNMLMKKAQTEIHKKLKEWSFLTEVPIDRRKKDQMKNFVEKISISVPDSDFHNFDKERTESSFGDDQIWAAYGDADGMPRYYARIHKVISLNPFKIIISWLNSRSNDELGPLDWIGSGFAKTCGEFKIGKREITETLNSFSHTIRWTKGIRGGILIFPRKGEVWALYRNWSPDWNRHTPRDLVHKYDMVEVLEDFNEEHGVPIAPLVKISGFRTVFRKQMDPNKVKRIPKEELFCLSHQVPNYLLTGQEAPNAPKGCWELDPAATPLELLQMVSEANEEQGEDILKGPQKTNVDAEED